MKNVRVSAVSLNQTPLAWDNNFENIKQALLECDKRGIQIVCFPELSISGYGCEDAFFLPSSEKNHSKFFILYYLSLEIKSLP